MTYLIPQNTSSVARSSGGVADCKVPQKDQMRIAFEILKSRQRALVPKALIAHAFPFFLKETHLCQSFGQWVIPNHNLARFTLLEVLQMDIAA